jgi:hypothetical protein
MILLQSLSAPHEINGKIAAKLGVSDAALGNDGY